MRALIAEDGLSRQALTAARALARAGWEVGIACQLRRGMAACSRSTRWEHHVPAPESDPEAFVTAVNTAIGAAGYEVVFGARDVDVLTLSASREQIEAVVPYPPHSALAEALDKGSLTEAAGRAGIAVPRTVPATPEALESLPEPVIVKSRLHVRSDGRRAPARLETTLARTRAEAARRVGEIRAAGGDPLLQEFLPGRLMAFVLVAGADGRVVAAVQQEADRVWPVGEGVSVRARTVPIDPELQDRVGALVADIGWTGLAELQFILPDDGLPRLIDFNGRFYGSMELAIAAGANLPALWASLATGRPFADGTTATPGVRFQWLYGDVRRCLDDGRPGLGRRLLDTVRYSRGAAESVLSLRDPLPELRHLAHVLGRSMRKALR